MDQICAVAVEVKQDEQSISSIWDIEKFQSKFNDLNELYQHWKTSEVLVSGFLLDEEFGKLRMNLATTIPTNV